MPVPSPISRSSRSPRSLLVCLVGLLLASSLVGCATRTVRHSVIKRHAIEVDLVREVSGFTVEKQGHEHPAIISTQRLSNILAAIEVETPAPGQGTIRQPAFAPEMIEPTAEGLAQALAEASPDEEVGVKVIRQESRLGLFDQKFLTAFIAYVDEGQLYLLLRRVDWPIKESEEQKRWPEPMKNRKVMNFRVVSGEPIYFAGVQDLEIDWQSDVFRQPFRLPGSTKGEKRRREVISSSPVPRDELESSGGDGVDLRDLTADQLRALADLEDDRREGRITELDYQRERRQLLRKR
jgi:hypothetical protein